MRKQEKKKEKVKKNTLLFLYINIYYKYERSVEYVTSSKC